jgi:dipeptidyl aminopeptidase/acylaminoacyl peptidase
MPELREVFEMTTKQMEPDQDSWKDQEHRQRRQARNRRVGAFAAVVVILIAAGLFVRSQQHAGSNRPARVVTSLPPMIGASTQQTAEIIGLDGSVKGTLPSLPIAYALAVSPDGSQLAYAQGAANGSTDIGVRGIDGAPLHWLRRDLNADMPAWSPDGTRLAFVATNGESNGRDLYVVDADGSHLRRLTSDAASEDQPSWSPDGSTIAYRNGSKREFNDDQEIWTIPVHGGTPTRLTHDHVPDEEPAWSPDGHEIAYVRGAALWVMWTDGSHAHQVLDDAFAPRWSPDGTRIVALRFVTTNESTFHLPFRGSWQHPRLDVVVVDPSTGHVTTVPRAQVAGDYAPVTWMPASYGDALVLNNVWGG